jgi:hypothetical protein
MRRGNLPRTLAYRHQERALRVTSLPLAFLITERELIKTAIGREP